MVDELKKLLDELKYLRKKIKAEKTKQIAKKALRSQAEELGSRWFTDIASQMPDIGLSEDSLKKYDSAFARLIKLSGPNNLKTSYVDVLNQLIKPFKDELIIASQTGPKPDSISILHKMLVDIADPTESEYLDEAVKCAQREFFRGAAILGWCAGIDRIHRKIEALGFAKFNVASAMIASQTKGRFKRFKKVLAVGSISELREVFDKDILWIIEGMELIDSNQHTRLRGCFDLRCQCAHPGEAPVTEYNLMSFFSDIKEIILDNDEFAVRVGRVPNE